MVDLCTPHYGGFSDGFLKNHGAVKAKNTLRRPLFHWKSWFWPSLTPMFGHQNGQKPPQPKFCNVFRSVQDVFKIWIDLSASFGWVMAFLANFCIFDGFSRRQQVKNREKTRFRAKAPEIERSTKWTDFHENREWMTFHMLLSRKNTK